MSRPTLDNQNTNEQNPKKNTYQKSILVEYREFIEEEIWLIVTNFAPLQIWNEREDG